jgi:hypothetical protein
MTATLATLRDRVELILADVTNAIYSTDTIDEAIRLAIHEYSQAFPQELETVITVPADGREIALDDLTGLLNVMDVWYPYDSDAATETWTPNEITGFSVYWDNNQPVLFLTKADGAQPQTDEEIRIWYSVLHTLSGLDSESTTTIRIDHESMLAVGASAKAAFTRAGDLVETANIDLYEVGLLGSWAVIQQRRFEMWLGALRKKSTRAGVQWGWSQGWRMDKWDL